MDEHALEQLAAVAGERLRQAGLLLVTAESCTGGMLAEAVTSVAGSSEWFERGFVTYSNASKQELLAVRAETLEQRGAVDEQTAREMALGALAASRASVSLAITGVAGPGGGSADKPVGTVCLAWADRSGIVRSETRRFAGERRSVRRQSAIRALEVLNDLLAVRLAARAKLS